MHYSYSVQRRYGYLFYLFICKNVRSTIYPESILQCNRQDRQICRVSRKSRLGGDCTTMVGGGMVWSAKSCAVY